MRSCSPFDANITNFRACRRLVCCYPLRVSRQTWVGTSMAFSSTMKIFLSYVPGMQVVGFTRSSSVARALPSTPICCRILQYPKRTKPSSDTWAIYPWVRAVPSFLCASLFQSAHVRVSDDVLLVATWLFLVIFFASASCLYSGPSPVDLACLRNHQLHACRWWYYGCHPQHIAVGRDRTHSLFPSIRTVVYGFSVAILVKKNVSCAIDDMTTSALKELVRAVEIDTLKKLALAVGIDNYLSDLWRLPVCLQYDCYY